MTTIIDFLQGAHVGTGFWQPHQLGGSCRGTHIPDHHLYPKEVSQCKQKVEEADENKSK